MPKEKYRGFTAAQAEASKRYLSQFRAINIRVSPDFRDRLNEYAKSKNISVASLIVRLCEEEMQRNP